MDVLKSSQKRFQWVGAVLTLLIIAPIALCVYWLIDRTPPLKAVTGQFMAWDKENPRSGHIVWRGIPVREDCEGTIYRYIVNGEIVTLMPRKWEYRGPVLNDQVSIDKRDIDKQDPITWDAPFEVPPHITHDAAYRNRMEFICNPLHKLWPIPISPPDVPFKLPDAAKTRSEVVPGPTFPFVKPN